MTASGKILCHRTVNPLGVEQITYEWDGGPITFVSGEFAQEYHEIGMPLIFGPFRLRVLNYNWATNMYTCVRDEGVLTQIIVFSHRAGKILRIIKARIIITMAVWKLAQYRPECIPSWDDIYVVKKIKGWLK